MTPRKSSARGRNTPKKTSKSPKPSRKASASSRSKPAAASRAKASSTKSKHAKVAKSAKRAKPAKSAKRAKSAKPAKAATPAARTKSAAAKSAAVKPAVVKPPAVKLATVKPAVEGRGKAPARAAASGKVGIARKEASGKSAAAVRKGVAAAAEVRPLGVLPPGSMARSSGRPAVAVHSAPLSSVRPAVVRAPATVARRVTGEELKEFEQRLLAERQKILKEMGHLENTVLKINQRDSAGDLSGYSFHMADVGTDAMEREKAFLFASSEGRALFQINEALRRLYRGEYGLCESCGEPIARARLEAIPHARLCLACKEKEERVNRGVV